MNFTLILIAAFVTTTAAGLGEDIAADGKSKLPNGEGIAAKFKADTGIHKHESVIYANGFEGQGDWKKLWDETRDKDGQVLSLVSPPGGDPKLGKHCLQAKATLGHDTGGGATKWFESSKTLFIRF